MNCLLCNTTITAKLTFEFIFSFHAEQHSLICFDCQKQFKKINQKHCCLGCGRSSEAQQCFDCERWQDNFKNRALYEYNDAMKSYFSNYKFQGDYYLRRIFQAEFSQFIIQNSAKNSVFVPIPVDTNTLVTRGFNQVTGLLNDKLNYCELLVSVRTEKQTHQYQNSRQRRLLGNNNFKINPKITLEDYQKKIVLIDDIYTTGHTLRQALKILQSQGYENVKSITMCR